jgi:hypothetical protein
MPQHVSPKAAVERQPIWRKRLREIELADKESSVDVLGTFIG